MNDLLGKMEDDAMKLILLKEPILLAQFNAARIIRGIFSGAVFFTYL